MQTRGYVSTAIGLAILSGIGFSVGMFLLLPPLFSLGYPLVMREGLGSDALAIARISSIGGGIVFGLIFGLVMAIPLRVITISVPVPDKEVFLSRLGVALAELDYHPQSQFNNLLTFNPSYLAGLLAGKVSVQLRPDSAMIVGPSRYVRKLQERLLDGTEYGLRRHTGETGHNA